MFANQRESDWGGIFSDADLTVSDSHTYTTGNTEVEDFMIFSGSASPDAVAHNTLSAETIEQVNRPNLDADSRV